MAKNISKLHYAYTNNIVQILGFKHLADYKHNLILRTISQEIVSEINKTIDIFKKLFLQQDFNLSRTGGVVDLSYVGTFIKKILLALQIPFEILRVKGE